jgi:hypothetical protein
VFGDYCGQALRVARCESGYRTTAQNGQYLGIFQMGSNERRLFGHGASALDQRARRIATSSARGVTGARGRASPGTEPVVDFVRKLRNPPGPAGSHRARSLVVERSCRSGGRSTA